MRPISCSSVFSVVVAVALGACASDSNSDGGPRPTPQRQEAKTSRFEDETNMQAARTNAASTDPDTVTGGRIDPHRPDSTDSPDVASVDPTPTKGEGSIVAAATPTPAAGSSVLAPNRLACNILVHMHGGEKEMSWWRVEIGDGTKLSLGGDFRAGQPLPLTFDYLGASYQLMNRTPTDLSDITACGSLDCRCTFDGY